MGGATTMSDLGKARPTFVGGPVPRSMATPSQTHSDLLLAGGIEIQKLVKEGKLTQEAALAYAEKCGIVPPKIMEQSMSLSKTKEVFNFSVYKWNKVRTVQRLILQFDFKSQTLSDIQQGRRAEKIGFQDVLSFQSEDGLRLLIQFASHGEYELDANTLDEKNKMIRLLSSILHHYEGEPGERRRSAAKPDFDEEENDKGHLSSESGLSLSMSPPPAVLSAENAILPPTLAPHTLKEGLVEKKGHSVAFLVWPERYLKVCEGELLYYRPEQREQALNIIPLKANVTRVEKSGMRGFIVSLVHSKKTFSFRTRGNDSRKGAETERDEWCKAIINGCRTRRKSDARLRRGTITAKQYMDEVKMEKKQKQLKKQTESEQEEVDDPFADLECSLDIDLNLPTSVLRPKSHKESVRARSQTVTSPHESPGSRKSLRRGKSDYDKRRSSTFYLPPDTTDVTTPFIRPMMEMEELRVSNRSQAELLDLMASELETLAQCVLPTTTGKSHIDIIFTRMGNILSALQQRILTDTKSVQSECDSATKSLNKQSLDPSSMHSSPSLPSQSLVDESRDACSVVSTDQTDTKKESSPLPTATLHSVDEVHSDTPDTNYIDANDHGADTRSKTISPPATSPYDNSDCAQADIDTVHTPAPNPDASVPTTSTPPAVPAPPPLPGVPPPPPPPLGVPPPPLLPGVPPPPQGMPGFGPHQSSLPALPEHRPTRKMKRFHWNLIAPSVVPSSVWLDVATKEIVEDIDYTELEKLFSAETQETKTPNIVKKNTVKSLLDNTRSRNIEIFLPSFPLKVESLTAELDQQLNVVDGSTKLNVEHIVALKRFQPTEEEREMYKKYAGDRNKLPLADTFLLKLIEVPMLAVRLDLLFTIREFPSNMDEFEPTLELAWNACHELDRSEEFLAILRYVLAIGNYLNAGTAKGNAYGFQLKYLPKLMEFRGHERISLLDFLVKQLYIKQPDLLYMPSQLEAVAKASEISITSILAEIEVMGNELDKIEQNGEQVAQHPRIAQKAGQQIQAEVKGFVGRYRARLAELDVKGQEISATYSKLLVKFGEKPSMDSEDFFSTIAQFLMQFKKISTERLLRLSPPEAKNGSPDISAQNSPSTKTPDLKKASQTRQFKKAMTVDIIEVQQDGAQKRPAVEPQSPTMTVLSQRTGGLKRKSKTLEPKADYLEKKASDGKWAKRYFDLEQSKLHYFTSKGQGYRQTIHMRGVPVRMLDTDKRVIEIGSESRIYHLRAKTTALAEEWLKALKSHSQT